MKKSPPLLLLPLTLLWLAGCATSTPPITLRLHEPTNPRLPASRVQMVTVPPANAPQPVHPWPTLTERDLTSAAEDTTDGLPTLVLRFDAHGANKLQEMTTRLRDQPIVLLINDQPVTALWIEHPLNEGELRLPLDVPAEQLRQWVRDLNQLARRRRDTGDVAHRP